ncbi:MAG: GNAT family N-acetyltransferase [Oscillospiraceae bacterium]|jgi:ribosomal protein S18 acetylase RimI-like enzyme|nr:GNAT family N-acetyltransferase [Oscillospiraceae bacterium]
MTDFEIIRHIDDGANFYIDFFANAEHMERADTGYYCYTRPLPGEEGITFAYSLRLEELSESGRLEKLSEIRNLGMPVWWGLCMSDALYALVHKEPRERLRSPSGGDELYMAIEPPERFPQTPLPAGVTVKRVTSPEMFAGWANFVNDSMFGGYRDIHPVYHYPACKTGKINCYICCKDGLPVAHCSIMDNDGICSLEFVATHPEHRRRGYAKAVCAFAMEAAFDQGAELITLRAINPGTKELFTALGYKIFNRAL